MAITTRTTTHMGISDARAKLTSVVNDVYRGDTRIVVEKSGIPVAAFVSPADLAKLEELDRKWNRLLDRMDEMQAAFADVSEEELIREADRAVQSVREQARAARQSAASTA